MKGLMVPRIAMLVIFSLICSMRCRRMTMTAGEEISCPNRAPKPWASEMKSVSSIPTLIEYI